MSVCSAALRLLTAELAASNPEAVGLYCYIRDGFGGRLPAFPVRVVCLFLVSPRRLIAALAAFAR